MAPSIKAAPPPKMSDRLAAIDSQKRSTAKLGANLGKLEADVATKQKAVQVAREAYSNAVAQRQGNQLTGVASPSADLNEATAKDELRMSQAQLQASERTLSAAKAEIHANQAELLKAEKSVSADTMGGVYGSTRTVDSVEDAAALTDVEQEQLFGMKVGIDPSVAAMKDAEKVAQARVNKTARTAAHMSAKVLANQLDGGSAKFQSELVAKATPLIKQMAAQANGNAATANGLLEAIGNAKGEARAQLVKTLASTISGSNTDVASILSGKGRGEFSKALGAKLEGGAGFDLAADLIREVKAQGKNPALLAELQLATTGALKSLRTNFEGKQQVANRLDRRVASFAEGWGPALSADPKDGAKGTAAAVQAFQKDHAGEYKARDAAAVKYLAAVDGLGDMPRLDSANAVKAEEMHQTLAHGILSPDAALELELNKLQKDLVPLFATGPGKEKLARAMNAAAMKAQAKKGGKIEDGEEGAWLQTLGDKVSGLKDGNDLRQSVQSVVGMGIARAALLAPDAKRSAALGEMLKQWKGPLGIDAAGIAEFEKKTGALFKPSRTSKEVGEALESLGEKDAKMTKGNKVLNGIGLMVALPATLQSIAEFGDASLANKLRTVADTTGYANQALSVLFDSKVLDKVAGRLNVAGSAIQVGQGIAALVNGDVVEGVSDTSMGVGGLMVAAGQLGSKVPGLQLVGAGLIVAGSVVGIFKKTEGDKIEEEAEGDLKKFLTTSGVSNDVAELFKDVSQADGRNVGSFITQAAGRLGVTPKALFDAISKKAVSGSPVEKYRLKEAIEMIKAMPLTADGKYVDKHNPKDKLDTVELRANPNGMAGVDYIGPRSMDTALLYLAKIGMAPPKK